MSKLIRSLIFGALALAMTDTLRAEDNKKFEPHKIPKDQFAQEILTIALRPTFLPSDTHQPEAVTARIETFITDILRSKGYAVVPSAEHERIWQLLSQRAGGAFDPVTGKPDDKKFEVVRIHTARELERLHHANAVLVSWITFSGVPPGRMGSNQMALWGDPITFHGQLLAEEPQLLVASNLAVGIYDVNGAELYAGQAGIEWTMVFVARGYDAKPADRLYDDTRVRHSLGVVLDPMVARSTRKE